MELSVVFICYKTDSNFVIIYFNTNCLTVDAKFHVHVGGLIVLLGIYSLGIVQEVEQKLWFFL